MCILGIPEQVDVNIDAECISAEKGSAPTLRLKIQWKKASWKSTRCGKKKRVVMDVRKKFREKFSNERIIQMNIITVTSTSKKKIKRKIRLLIKKLGTDRSSVKRHEHLKHFQDAM